MNAAAMRSALFALLALTTAASAAPRKVISVGGPVSHAPPACGAKVIPLVVGNTWSYASVAAPLPADPLIAKIAPPVPVTFVITVKTVDTQKSGDTVVTLEEKVTYNLEKDTGKPLKPDDRVLTTTITCNTKGKFDVSPDSYFFAGEPGGMLGMQLADIKRPRDTSYKLVNGTIGSAEWREDIAATFTRAPTAGVDAKLSSGKLELERKFQPSQPESVSTKMGAYMAEKLVLTTTGRVTLDGGPADAKPSELPAGWTNTLWLAPGVGMVQSLNSYAHMYQLTEAQLK